MVNILIVDEHSFMRRVIRDVIEKEADLEVVAEASNGQEAEWQASQIQPDVILINREIPDCSVFEATERILACSSHSHIIIFTPDYDAQYVIQAVQRGAMSYISKEVAPDTLVAAIRCAAPNDLYIPGALANQMLNYLRPYWPLHPPYADMFAPISYRTRRLPGAKDQDAEHPHTNVPRPLTEREKEILDLMRCGRKNREIAGELCIAESTVHKHVQNILEKLHARNRTEAIYLTSVRPLH